MEYSHPLVYNKVKMIGAGEQERILQHAYVPEHIVSLMVLISKGEPFLVDHHLCFTGGNWLIVIGYPLEADYSHEACRNVLEKMMERHNPEYVWFAGPESLTPPGGECLERESDHYYTFDVEGTKPRHSVVRAAEKAAGQLRVERTKAFTREHEGIVAELLQREQLPQRVRELYGAMPRYVKGSPSSVVLDARDRDGRLTAFYVVDLGASAFATYLLGAHSRAHYVAHASDLLFYDMIQLSREHGKAIINLGLGVNPGIRRFKEKWGGKVSLPYELCAYRYGRRKGSPFTRLLEGRL